MATDIAIAETPDREEPLSRSVKSASDWRRWVAPLASLKLTVTLFAMSTYLVLIGTLAQVDKDIWDVVRDYFRTPFALVPLEIHLPRTCS